MAPLPPSNTARLKVFYQNSLHEHDVIIRVPSITEAPDAEAVFTSIVADLTASYNFSEVTRVEFAQPGSDLFFPYASTTLIGTNWGSGPATPESDATALSFTGRSVGGRRAKVFFFGYKNALSAFRITSAESTSIDSIVDTLTGAETSFLAIDGLEVLWNGYANVKANDHWVRKARD